ncbi:MAG: PEP/pyruvate-binding domain-containing protein [Vulcanimicrobiota bacterium]
MPSSRRSGDFRFGTKAATLERLRPLVDFMRIAPLVAFSLQEWRSDSQACLGRVAGLGPVSLVVRSSAIGEDSHEQSMAGAYLSLLDIDGASPDRVREAIEQVFASYRGNPLDQVLVQPMVSPVLVSGVITTFSVDDGAPYLVINYDDDSGRTDRITGGKGAHKSVWVYRKAGRKAFESERVARWVRLSLRLERLCGDKPLDIEFGETPDGEFHLFQVRPLATAGRWSSPVTLAASRCQPELVQAVRRLSQRLPGVLGRTTIWGAMADWNPAEMIGPLPRPLAASLYRHLITDSTWRLARARMGYRHPGGQPLMVLLAGRPFIDIRASFNSFLPATLGAGPGFRLVEAWLDRLAHHPEFHDKVEFEVALTCRDFKFAQTVEERYPGVLSPQELGLWEHGLTDLTRQALAAGGTLEQALRLVRARRPALRPSLGPLQAAWCLFERCRRSGTLPFAIVARHAFIAEALLRSAVQRGALEPERLSLFRQSVPTVARQFTTQLREVSLGQRPAEAFFAEFGHLRPGTYEIMSRRYDQSEDLFQGGLDTLAPAPHQVFELQPTEEKSLALLLAEARLDTTPARLLDYAAQAIAGREEAKFLFTRDLSDGLEQLARWGQTRQLTREQVSYLEVADILDERFAPHLQDPSGYWSERSQLGLEKMRLHRCVHLSYLLRSWRDVLVAPAHRAVPNFITDQRVEAEGVALDAATSGTAIPDLFGRLALIEQADPGFDWVFTRGIAGLVTQYGGPNSHMAVRCAELSLPAAIGCGENLFGRLRRARRIELNCLERVVRPVLE